MKRKRLALALLPGLLGSCALLGTAPGGGLRGIAAPPARTVSPAAALSARAEAILTGQGVTVGLTLLNLGPQPLSLRYAAQVNWGACGLPPYVALSRAGGPPLSAPLPAGRLTCPELRFSRILAPGERLTLRRPLPSPPPGTYTLTAWFDGEVEGKPVRVQADPVGLKVPGDTGP